MEAPLRVAMEERRFEGGGGLAAAARGRRFLSIDVTRRYIVPFVLRYSEDVVIILDHTQNGCVDDPCAILDARPARRRRR